MAAALQSILAALEADDGEDAFIDRETVRDAVLEALTNGSEGGLPLELREDAHRWLLLSPNEFQPSSLADAPPSIFGAYVSQQQDATPSTIKDDVREIGATVLAPAHLGVTRESVERELQGMVEYLCRPASSFTVNKVEEEVLSYHKGYTFLAAFYIEAALAKAAGTSGIEYAVTKPGADDASRAEALPCGLSIAFLLLRAWIKRFYPKTVKGQTVATSGSQEDVDVSDSSDENHISSALNQHIFRLVLQYHDPELSMHLEGHNATPGEIVFGEKWLRSLLINPLGQRPCQTIWDALAAADNPLLLPLCATVLLMESRAELLQTTGQIALQAQMMTVTFPEGTAAKVLKKAQELLLETPVSMRSSLLTAILGCVSSSENPNAHDPSSYSGCVVWPSEVEEIANSFANKADGSASATPAPSELKLRYVILDCRAERSYHYARLPTAVHVGAQVGFDPEMLKEMIARFESARGSHFAVLGTGRPIIEEINLLKIIALQLISAGFPHVSVVTDGFKGFVPYIRAHKMEIVRTPGYENAAKEKDASSDTAEQTGQQKESITATLQQKIAISQETRDAAAKKAAALQEEAAKRAAKLASSASAASTAAKSWGFGILSKAKESYVSYTGKKDKDDVAAAGANEDATPVLDQPAASTQAKVQNSAESSNKAASGGDKESTASLSKYYELQHDDDDQDFDLIMDIAPEAPAKPVIASTSVQEEQKSQDDIPDQTPTISKTEEATPAKPATLESAEESQKAQVEVQDSAPISKTSDDTQSEQKHVDPNKLDSETKKIDISSNASQAAKNAAEDIFGELEDIVTKTPAAHVSSSKPAETSANKSVVKSDPHPFDDLFD